MRLADRITLCTPRMAGYVEVNIRGVVYQPFERDEAFKRLHALVPPSSPINLDAYWNLYVLARQSLHVPGDFIECGVFAGGSASFLANIMEGSGKTLHLFDSWKGLPALSERDHIHFQGEFSNCSIEETKKTVGHEDFVRYHKGWMPQTFVDVAGARIAFAHIDVDLYQSVKDCCSVLYKRMTAGGIMVFDDYGHYTCPGAREAVDEFFADKPENPLLLITGQAVMFKL